MRNAMLCFLLVVAGLSVSSAAQNKPAKDFRIHRFFPTIVAQIQLTGQSAPIPPTTLLTPAKNGTYRVSANMVPVAVPGVGTLDLNLLYTDDGGQEVIYFIQQEIGPPPDCNGVICGAVTTVRDNAGVPFQFSVDVIGNVTYDLFITVERLQ